MKYCSQCRREFLDSDNSCRVDGTPLKPRESDAVTSCDLCGRIVKRGENVCTNCGARVAPHESNDAFSAHLLERHEERATAGDATRSGRKEADAPWFVPQNDDLQDQDELFPVQDPPERSGKKRTGGILLASGFVVGVAVGLVILRGAYNASRVPPEKHAGAQGEAVSPPKPPPLLPPGDLINQPPAAKEPALEREAVPLEQPAPANGGENSASSAMPNPNVGRDSAPLDKKVIAGSHPTERSTPVSLKIPSGVRIPSPEELRRKKAQHEAELSSQTITFPAGVEIPSPGELRRKKIEHEIEQAIRNRAIEGVTVSMIGNTIFLRGQVATERQKAAAESAARAAADATNVRSAISVRGARG